MTMHDRKNQSDSITHPYGHKSDLINPLKNALKGTGLSEESFVDNYLDEKITQTVKMTAQLRSTLKSLESKINIPRTKVILESHDVENVDE